MSVVAAGLAPAASLDDRIEALFRPPVAELAALSADGQRVAYTAPAAGKLTIVMQLLEPLGPRRTVPLEPERPASALGGAASPDSPAPALPLPPARLRFLRWSGPHRLVFAPVERIEPLPPVPDAAGTLRPNPDGPAIHAPIYAIDADGRHRGTLVDARHFMETPEEARQSLADLLKTPDQLVAARPAAQRVSGWRMPHLDILGFHPREPDQLIIATRGAHSVPAQHLVDTRTATVREFGGDWPAPPGPPQVFDWFRLKSVGERRAASPPSTVWHDPELARLQRELDARFPRRVVELVDWSDNRSRVLVRVTGGSDPGRLFVLQRPEETVLELTRLAPWLKPAHLHDTRPFACTAPSGAALGGYLTWPAKPRAARPPLLVVFPSTPGEPPPAWDPEAQLFADFGFAVLRLNAPPLAVAAVGADATAPDRRAVDDAHAAVAWLAATRSAARAFDDRRVAAFGRGVGGYLAVRAVQLRPATFHAASAIDAPLGSSAWLASPPAERPAAPPLAAALARADSPASPVLLFGDGPRATSPAGDSPAPRAAPPALGEHVERATLDPDFAAGRPAALAAVYRRIDAFFTAHLQPAEVKIGVAREVP